MMPVLRSIPSLYKPMATVAQLHRPVLLEEVLSALNVRQDGIYVDATFGRGGHSGAILERLGPDGHLLALDQDPEAQQAAEQRFSADPRFRFVPASFDQLADIVTERGWLGQVDGVLMDLGVSSPQLDCAERGFSFSQDGPLDMRMNPAVGESAAQWLATAPEKEIAAVLKDLGEERFAKRIARHLLAAREEAPITRTAQLAALIAEAMPYRELHKHPATRSFQAIRLHVNQELPALDAALAATPSVLAPGGRLAVISFHSLEDRRVKQFMRREARGQTLPRHLPIRGEAPGKQFRLLGKAIRPSEAEVAANPRSRSAVLRVAERLS